MTRVKTDYPIALDSNDHLIPRGAIDQRGHEGIEFFRNLKLSFPDITSVLDIGTGSGFFVKNGLAAGYEVYGIDGTDKVDMVEPWISLKDTNLFHADLRFPFNFFEEQGWWGSYLFDLITAWDVMEHLTEDTIDVAVNNIANHLKPKTGVFMATIEFTNKDNELYHTLCKPREWWINKFAGLGLLDIGFNPILLEARQSPRDNCFLMRRN